MEDLLLGRASTRMVEFGPTGVRVHLAVAGRPQDASCTRSRAALVTNFEDLTSDVLVFTLSLTPQDSNGRLSQI
jgi:hypothetical protein